MNLIKRIKWKQIFTDVISCFIVSCGVALLIIFFYYENISLEKESIKNSVQTIFSILLVCLIGFNIIVKTRWLYDKSIVNEPMIVEKPITNRAISDYNKKISAIHEAGHAVMVYLLGIDTYNVQVSHLHPKIVTVLKDGVAKDVENMILIKYSGAIAEELFDGNIHLGCMGGHNSDFVSATELIKAYIIMTDSNVSKSLLNEELCEQIILLSNKFYEKAKSILIENRNMIEVIADELMKRHSLSENDIALILDDLKKID